MNKTKCRYAKNGLSKRIIVLKGPENSGFEEAIFVLREEDSLSPQDFLKEAERIADGFADSPSPPIHACLLWILSGLSFCLALSWVFYFIMR